LAPIARRYFAPNFGTIHLFNKQSMPVHARGSHASFALLACCVKSDASTPLMGRDHQYATG
jgi:hypothetical protein